jgi:hypothetical protein
MKKQYEAALKIANDVLDAMSDRPDAQAAGVENCVHALLIQIINGLVYHGAVEPTEMLRQCAIVTNNATNRRRQQEMN